MRVKILSRKTPKNMRFAMENTITILGSYRIFFLSCKRQKPCVLHWKHRIQKLPIIVGSFHKLILVAKR